LKRKSCLYYTSLAQVVGELAHCTETQSQALCDYALHLGMAVQIIEETLCSIRANEADQHKQSNLPFIVIRGLHQANPALRQLIQTGQPAAQVIGQICIETDALAYTHSQIESEIKRAIEAVVIFSDNIYRQALQDLATGLLVQFDQDLVDLGY
ncbi:MAG: octaprenyl-diphosphate synthase, partial [Phenylobacterium sp.]